MRKLIVLFVCVASFSCFAQKSGVEKGLATINKSVIQAQLEFLSSDWMEGREAGTKGNYMAGDYLQSLLKLYGLKAGGDEEVFIPNRYQDLQGARKQKYTSYFQKFAAVESVPTNGHKLKFTFGNSSVNYKYKTDFDLSLSMQSKEISAPVVFVGYGFTHKESGYDSFKKLDLNGKVVVRLAGLPGKNNEESKAAKLLKEHNIEIGGREKNAQTFERGALAVLEYDPSNKDQLNWAENQSFYYNEAMYEGETKPESFYAKRLRLPTDKNSQPYVKITTEVMSTLLKSSGKALEKVLKKAAELQNISEDLEGSIELKIGAETKIVELRNILGIVEGENPDKIMVVGAHYDHLGKYNGQIFNGADDNGSGVVAVTTIAKAFMETGIKPKCTVIFALWDGEERGLLGSRYFIDHFEEMDKTVLYLNFDMVGRNGSAKAPGNKVAMIYTKAYQSLVDTSKDKIKKYDLNLDVNFSGVDNPVGGSDNAGFARNEVPIFWFHTGGHTDYHKASDHVELINWQKLEDIIKLSFLNMWEFANNPELIEEN